MTERSQMRARDGYIHNPVLLLLLTISSALRNRADGMDSCPPPPSRRISSLLCFRRVVFDEKWRPPRRVIMEINVQGACELLIGKIPNGNPGEIKFSLYLLAQLTYGIALIVQKRGDILCSKSSTKSKMNRKKRAKRSDLLILDSSFETIESEHLKFVLDYSAITLHEDIPLPEIDILFNDDFGPLTAAEALQMEALLKEDNEHIIESKSGSINGSKECILNTVPEVSDNNTNVGKATHVFEMMEVSDESEICKARQYDLGCDETLRESEIKHPTYLSVLELSEVHDSQMLAPKKKRRKHGTVIDEITMFNKMQLQAQIDSCSDVLHTRAELITQLSKHRMITVRDLFDAHPMTLREFSKIPMSNLDGWIAAPEYDKPPLQYEEAMQLEPMQAPPIRLVHHSLIGREMSNEPTSHESNQLQDVQRQTVTPVMEDIERGRRNTTSTAPFGSTHITDPSSLRSDEGLPVAYDGNRQFGEKMKVKVSVATIIERISKEDASQGCMDNEIFTLSAEKARVTDLFSNFSIESELCGTRLESSTENVLVDERYSEYEIRHEGSQNEISVQKISVMKDPFQLKFGELKNTIKAGDNSIPVYYKTQKADDLLRLITEFIDFYKISKLCFSELIRGRSAVFAAKAFTNLLGSLRRSGLSSDRFNGEEKRGFKSWEAEFQQAVEKRKQLSGGQDTPTKLKLYGLYKQATIGDTDSKRPLLPLLSQAKYDAWRQFKGKSKDEAQKMYIDLISKLSTMETEVSATVTRDGLKPVPGLDIFVQDKVLWIKLNRPSKYNALTLEMYDGITNALNYANEIDTTVTAFIGSGQYFCSGNDLSNFTKCSDPANTPRMISEVGQMLSSYVAAHINHKKALVALINGPAVGIAVTVLPLFDLVVTSSEATFSTPFTSLGQSPEGCSSYTFPLIMGHSKASEILIFGKKLTAQEAFERNLACRVVPSSCFREEAKTYIGKISQLPPESLFYNKELLRNIHREALLAQNEREVSLLMQRLQSADCMDAIQRFMIRKM
ncbi:unnamed protein product [Litomosoides sigmodontis]|uniref:ACB domain-containing protein n=1 Tax=Litomosoides sigmodontis TaxID=42156 RepID=A0A3P6SU37_LITSI|nr:unnamed protein product [Litomosoides sigmodontis]